MALWNLRKAFKAYPSEDKEIIQSIKRMIGVAPTNLPIYKLALRHTSASVVSDTKKDFKLSNERLEYLGDAVLGAIVADFLYKKYPFKDEGFLTEIRSRIVNRESLNRLARKIGLSEIVTFEGKMPKGKNAFRSMYGDAFEAFVGAIFLDMGFDKCKKIILKKMILPHIDIQSTIENNLNYKSIMIEWAQKFNHKLEFKIIKEKGNSQNKEFVAQIIVDDKPVAEAIGRSKKKAEKLAAERAYEILEVAQS